MSSANDASPTSPFSTIPAIAGSSTSVSTVVLLRALEERQLIDSQRGQIAIGWLIVEDLVMVLTLVLLPAIAGMVEKGDVGLASLA
ncbi:cation:proton antiporter, partial [Klebsiella aerogenes]|uniref:cation:proton antiporter domain-containing protein n=1 Tax=Klebsiella aerogenes TaxID=548 RepID=UPI00222813D6